jgi:signal transduction histidine kinase
VAVIRNLPDWVFDLALVTVVGAISIGNAAHHGGLLWLTLPATVAATAALLLRHRWPLGVLAVDTALAVAMAALGRFWLVVAVLFAVAYVASRRDRRTSLRATAAAVIAIAVPTALVHDHALGTVPELAFFAVAWLWGDARRTAELDREAGRLQAAADERARIARELHDVITHNVSVMVVQAAAADDVFDARPDRAREALRAIEDTGRGALAELRRLLDVEQGGDGTLPQPSLARVDELIANVRAAGLPVSLEIEGQRAPLPEGVDLSAYRILQEALTNTLKHAGATRADVRVRYGADAVELEVSDDGSGGTRAAAGRGILGMRERAALFGGELHAGSRPGGGFTVRARMPLGAT